MGGNGLRMTASGLFAAFLAGAAINPVGAQTVSVTAYHNDTLRTGWNPQESILTTASVGGGTFTLQHSVPLDDQVDAQPLVVANQTITGQGVHTVVYVVTENDSVYAIDGVTGAVLLSRNLGTPVPQTTLPGHCINSTAGVGIASTPAISVANDELYLVADTYENNAPVFRLHALGLEDLQDKVTPVVVSAAHLLNDGSTVAFTAATSRQRAALLLSGSTIYSAFASYCDHGIGSRGWLLGWDALALTPLQNSELTDQLATAPTNTFLASIWMSGYGPATSGPASPIVFVTGNSDRSGTTFDATYNLAESLVELSSDLSQVVGHFTPFRERRLDQHDADFGSGGAMLLPPQLGLTPNLVVAAGKAGRLFLIDSSNPNGPPLDAHDIHACFCGPSYFVGSDGLGRVVTGSGTTLTTWLVINSASSKTVLVPENQIAIATGQDGGFFTSISSNATQGGSTIIWAVGRPTDSNPADVTLFAIDPVEGSIIYSSVAGTWPNVRANANIVPTVANGQVYVASDRELAIFGLGDGMSDAGRAAMLAARTATRALALSASNPQLGPGERAISGRVIGVSGSVLRLETRTGAVVLVDTAGALRNADAAVAETGNAIQVVGVYAKDGVLSAHYVNRTKDSPLLWQPDR